MQVDGALSYTQMLLGIDETANSEYYDDYLQRPASYEVKKNIHATFKLILQNVILVPIFEH
jgi:hypothetical protein